MRLKQLLFEREISQCRIVKAANDKAGAAILCPSRLSRIINGKLRPTEAQRAAMASALVALDVAPEDVQRIDEIRT